jgi:hypothetical protein
MLDYILLRGDVNSEQFKVILGESSDHLVIMGIINI